MEPKRPDIMAPRIGEEAERPREACPDCKHKPPTTLGLGDFPETAHEEIRRAWAEGATLLGCEKCRKRWAVIRQRIERDADGVASVVPVANVGGVIKAGPTPKKGAGRRMRRAQHTVNARAIRRNLRLAAASGDPVTGLREVGSTMSPEERRKARNTRKAAKRGAS